MKYKKKSVEERYCIYCQAKFMQPRCDTFTCPEHRGVISARNPLRFCSICGESFYATKEEGRYCEKHAGGKISASKAELQIDDEMSDFPVRTTKRIEDDDNYKARAKISKKAWEEEKLSYGQYVAKYNL